MKVLTLHIRKRKRNVLEFEEDLEEDEFRRQEGAFAEMAPETGDYVEDKTGLPAHCLWLCACTWGP